MVIGVIAVILGIALPVMARVRGASFATKSAVNVRTLHATIIAYTDQYRERYPVVEVGVMYPTVSYDMLVSFPYWQVYTTWTGVVFELMPYNQNIEVYLSPLARRHREENNVWPTSYHYSTSFAGDPALWQQGGADNPALQRSVRSQEVAYPSQKALLWDDEATYIRRPLPRVSGDPSVPVPIGFVDGSVRTLKPAEASHPVTNLLGGPVNSRRLHNTENGVRGIDFSL